MDNNHIRNGFPLQLHQLTFDERSGGRGDGGQDGTPGTVGTGGFLGDPGVDGTNGKRGRPGNTGAIVSVLFVSSSISRQSPVSSSFCRNIIFIRVFIITFTTSSHIIYWPIYFIAQGFSCLFSSNLIDNNATRAYEHLPGQPRNSRGSRRTRKGRVPRHSRKTRRNGK